MLKQELQTVFNNYDLPWIDTEGNEKPFADVLSYIYMNWHKDDLQNFMNDILAIEVNGKGDPFERDANNTQH